MDNVKRVTNLTIRSPNKSEQQPPCPARAVQSFVGEANGLPAVRTGAVGFGVWRGGYHPLFEVFAGSSNVFISSLDKQIHTLSSH
jgi:hypothetical protein